jgi:hypothetical protein
VPYVFGPQSWVRFLPSKAKKKSTLRNKNLDLYYFLLLFDCLSFKTDVNVHVPLKSKKQKKLRKKLILSATDEKKQDQDPDPSIERICGSGFVPKCYGSTILIAGHGSVPLSRDDPHAQRMSRQGYIVPVPYYLVVCLTVFSDYLMAASTE